MCVHCATWQPLFVTDPFTDANLYIDYTCKCDKDLVPFGIFFFFFFEGGVSRVSTTYSVDLNGVDPLVSVFGVLCSQVPHAVINADV